MAEPKSLFRKVRARLWEREALLLPLPEVTWFPKTRLPLYVFEPRYRALVTDAERKRLPVAVVQLKHGWELEQKQMPPIHHYCTFGRFVLLERFLDGRFNVVLQGEHRCRILEEKLSSRGYRKAWVKVEDLQVNVAAARHNYMRNHILDRIKAHFSEDALSLTVALKFAAENSVDGLLYQLLQQVHFDAETKQQLLELPTLTALYREFIRLLKSVKHPPLSSMQLKQFPYLYLGHN